MPDSKHMTLEEWRAEGKRLFGDDVKKWRFVCTNCGHIQSIEDFSQAGIEEPESKAYFSCIGRWTNGKGTLNNKKSPCNFTNGGFFVLGPIFVKDADGDEHPMFDFDRSEETNA